MSLALLDRITPWRRDRIARFLKREGSDYTYLVHVGVGWAMARWPGSIKPILKRLDPVLGWLAIDGYGFHEGYFHWPSYLSGQPAPKRLKGYARRVFDQGLGRSLWFVEGAKVDRIVDSIQRFPVDRHADLWSGIGLACVYAGEISETDLYTLVRSSGRFHPHLAQGAAFAAKARLRGGNPTPYTEQACQCVCGTSAAAAAQITDFALQAIDHSSAIPTYEQWRLGIQQRFH